MVRLSVIAAAIAAPCVLALDSSSRSLRNGGGGNKVTYTSAWTGETLELVTLNGTIGSCAEEPNVYNHDEFKNIEILGPENKGNHNANWPGPKIYTSCDMPKEEVILAQKFMQIAREATNTLKKNLDFNNPNATYTYTFQGAAKDIVISNLKVVNQTCTTGKIFSAHTAVYSFIGDVKRQGSKNPAALLVFGGTDANNMETVLDDFKSVDSMKGWSFNEAGNKKKTYTVNGGLGFVDSYSEALKCGLGTKSDITVLDGLDGKDEIFIVGHSLGGGIAQIAARVLQQQYPQLKIRLHTFASPRSIQKGELKHMDVFQSPPYMDASEKYTVNRWYATGDIFPTLIGYETLGLRHVGNAIQMNFDSYKMRAGGLRRAILGGFTYDESARHPETPNNIDSLDWITSTQNILKETVIHTRYVELLGFHKETLVQETFKDFAGKGIADNCFPTVAKNSLGSYVACSRLTDVVLSLDDMSVWEYGHRCMPRKMGSAMTFKMAPLDEGRKDFDFSLCCFKDTELPKGFSFSLDCKLPISNNNTMN